MTPAADDLPVGLAPQTGDCFALSHAGRLLPDLSVLDHESGQVIDLFRCRICAALTDSPPDHAQWHADAPSPDLERGADAPSKTAPELGETDD